MSLGQAGKLKGEGALRNRGIVALSVDDVLVVDLSALGRNADDAASRLMEFFPASKARHHQIRIEASGTSAGKVKDVLKRTIHHLKLKPDYRVLINRNRINVVEVYRPATEIGRSSTRKARKRPKHSSLVANCPHCGKIASSQAEYWSHVQVHYVGLP